MNVANTPIHCIGLGGMCMAPLAIYLAQLCYRVSGQYDALSDPVPACLARYGLRVPEN